MPTWGATQYLLATHRNDDPPIRTNSEPVAPILRNSPKDFATLYTVLSMAQEISAVVVGPSRRVIFTLDMDLYKLALQVQQSTGNKQWLLQPGHLQKFFADLHALGKVIEGSGLDTIAVESGVYSSAAVRGILGGKQYTRGVEFHIMIALAILTLKMECTLGESIPQALKDRAKTFKDKLHDDQPEILDIYSDLANYYTEDIKPNLPDCSEGLPKFLNNYLSQGEGMLTCISTIHSRDLEGTLAAIDAGVKYYGAMDLPWYFKLIPIYLGQMNEVRTSDPETWELLKRDFVVTKSTQAFCNLFLDQGLEQEIKSLKQFGALPGLTQDEEAMDRFVTTSPHLARMVKNFLHGFPKYSDFDDPKKKPYHQLQGTVGLRCALNSIRIRECIVAYCQGNPFALNTQLRNITSAALLPIKAAEDILEYPVKGQQRYEELVQDWLLLTSEKSIWDTLPQLKLKRFST